MATISPPPPRVGDVARSKVEWPYADDVAVVRPLNVKTDIGEKAAVTCYLNMKRDGLEEWTFPGMEHPDLGTFLSCCQRGFILGFDADEQNIIGFGSLLELEYPPSEPGKPLSNGKASAMYCFFRHWHHKDEIRHASRLALRYWFKEFRLRLIMGSALERNMAARAFGARLGFRECGRVPQFFWKGGKAEGAVILALERGALGGLDSGPDMTPAPRESAD